MIIRLVSHVNAQRYCGGCMEGCVEGCTEGLQRGAWRGAWRCTESVRRCAGGMHGGAQRYP